MTFENHRGATLTHPFVLFKLPKCFILLKMNAVMYEPIVKASDCINFVPYRSLTLLQVHNNSVFFKYALQR